MEDVTRAEKAALYFHILERCDDWKELYKIAVGEKQYNTLAEKSKITTASRWKSSHRIQKAKEEIERNLKALKAEIEQKARENGDQEQAETSKRERPTSPDVDINFLDPDQFLQFANQQANQINDEKERRAYLEMIAKLMNYKDKDEAEQEQIRAYLPIICDSCELRRRCESCKLNICPVEV
jgi:hypothetical protein